MYKGIFFTIIFFFLLFVENLYAQSNANKPTFNPLSSNVVVFFKDIPNVKNDIFKRKLSAVLNNADIEVWTIEKADYSSIRFMNGTTLYLTSSITPSNAILYKKGKPYMVVNLNDTKIENIINKYFDKLVYPELLDRNKSIVEDSLEGIIYITYSQKELFDDSILYDDEEQTYLKIFRNKKKDEVKRYSQQLRIPYKEVAENVSEIRFSNGISINLGTHGGSVILFKQGRNPQIFYITDISFSIMEQYFAK